MKLLNTRSEHQAGPLKHYVETALNSESISLPLLLIEPTPSKEWQALCPVLPPDLLIFISANAVDNSIKYLQQAWHKLPQVIAIGSATKSALIKHNVINIIKPEHANSDSLIQHPILKKINNKTILIIKGESGRKVLQDHINTQGSHLIELNVYRRCCPKNLSIQINKTWQNHKIDLILITSIESMNNLLNHASPPQLTTIKNTPWLVLSERIKEEALAHNVLNVIVSPPSGIEACLYALKSKGKIT